MFLIRNFREFKHVATVKFNLFSCEQNANIKHLEEPVRNVQGQILNPVR